MFTLNTRRERSDLRVLAEETTAVYFRCIPERVALLHRSEPTVAATVPLPPLEAHPLTQRVGGFCHACCQWSLSEQDWTLRNAVTLDEVHRWMDSLCVRCGAEDSTRVTV